MTGWAGRGMLCTAALALLGGLAVPAADKSKDAEKSDKKGAKAKDKDKSVKLPPAQGSKATTCADAIAEGKQRIVEMDYRSAENSFEKAVQLAKTPDEKAESYKGLASAVQNQGEHKKAVEILLRSTELASGITPEDGRVTFLNTTLNEAYRISAWVLGDWKLTHKVCESALALAGASAAGQMEWYKRNIRAFSEEGDTKRMEEWNTKGLARAGISPREVFALLSSTAGSYSDLAWRKGRDATLYTRAVELYSQALAVADAKPNSKDLSSVYNAIGGCLHWLKKYSEARASFGRTLAMQPATDSSNIFSAVMGTGWAFKEEGNAAQARQFFDRAMQMAEEAHNESWKSSAAKGLESL